jgi:hypothetical protein
MVTPRVFDEIIDFITSGPMPQDIIAFKPSEQLVKRIEVLLERKRKEALSDADREELEQYMVIEHIMRLAKARARQRLAAA